VTKSFNSKTACTSRVYEYLMPTYAYAPFEETNVAYRITS
jgi:tRNA U38,U39,U40 pseudouridine synthase TruA